jgi:hypothetical protein
MVVPTGDDNAARLDECACSLLDDFSELVVERLVHLIEQQNLRICLLRDGESESRAHALRIGGDRLIEGVTKLATVPDRIESPARRSTRQPAERAEEHCVLPSGEQVKQPSVDRQQ